MALNVQYHFVNGFAWCCHWLNVCVRFDDGFQQERAVCIEHFLDGILQFLSLGHETVRYVVRIRHFSKVGICHWSVRTSVTEEHVLPLAYVAKEVVVEQNHLYRDVVLHDGAELLDDHLQSAVAHEAAHRSVRCSVCSSHGGRDAVAHSAQAAGRSDAAALMVLEVTCRHKLVLTDICDEYCVFCQF